MGNFTIIQRDNLKPAVGGCKAQNEQPAYNKPVRLATGAAQAGLISVLKDVSLKSEKITCLIYLLITLSLVILGAIFIVLVLFPDWFGIPTSHWGLRRVGLLLAGLLLLVAGVYFSQGTGRDAFSTHIRQSITPPIEKLFAYLVKHKVDLLFIGLAAGTLLAGVWMYLRTLSCYPGTGDDLHKLGSVFYNPNPLNYFIGDQGMHPSGPNYRPLTTTTWWILQRLFGMTSVPQQVFNFLLHFANTALLYILLYKINKNRFLALALSGVYLFGVYSSQVVLDIPDRAGGMVDFWLLLMLIYLVSIFPSEVTARSILPLCGLYLLAFFSRENGIVLPLFVIAIAIFAEHSFSYRIQWIAVSAAALLFYFGLRWVAMGPSLVDYSNYGYLAGLYYYDYPAELPGIWQYLAYLDILLKNLVAPALQGFIQDGGSLLDQAFILNWLPMWVSSGMLLILAASRRPALYQKWALILIVLNAGIHMVLFRYRNHNTSQMAALMFIAAAPVMVEKTRGWRLYAIQALIVVLLLSSLSWAWQQTNHIVTRNVWAPAYFGSTDNEYKQHWSNQFDRLLVENILDTCSLP